jgi:hypothetical protein
MVSSDHIPPGGKGKITAKIDIQGRRGLLSKSIRVFSNDPLNPTVVLSLKAAIENQLN